MAGSGGDSFVDPTANPIFIFDDAVYFTEALLLSPTENEDHLDAQLAMAAELSEIEQPYKILALDPEPKPATKPAPEAFLETEVPASLAATSALSLQSEQRSSASIRSQETQSTGYTSQPSRRTSHDHATSDLSHAKHKSPSLFRASLSLDRSSYLAEPLLRANHMPKKSMSSVFGGYSVMSSSSSMRERTSRKSKRASALFQRFKRTSSVITSKPYREPRSGEEVDMVILGRRKDHAFPSPDLESLRDSGYSEDGESSLDLPRGLDIKVSMAENPVETFLDSPGFDDSSSPPKEISEDEKLIDIDPMKCDDFRNLRNEQREQYQRISLFEANQWKALAVHQHCTLKGIEAQFKTDRHDILLAPHRARTLG
ncbi:hypothetical protein DM02DRAFT_400107 [Periconia macrospinosa]|uniref:Uncharacterized protein n=1 Tax=Periconia macrospinosa TaxID=97972 RepID=A0A2V1DSE8_9PLEO|nr:hypothetical protein DM02DRAFT_400107 [Periconia macrospinosa]